MLSAFFSRSSLSLRAETHMVSDRSMTSVPNEASALLNRQTFTDRRSATRFMGGDSLTSAYRETNERELFCPVTHKGKEEISLRRSLIEK